MLILVVIIILIPMYGVVDKITFDPIALFLVPILGASILTGTAICIRDVFLRFNSGKRAWWVFLLLVINAFSYPYYVKNYALKPRIHNEEKI